MWCCMYSIYMWVNICVRICVCVVFYFDTHLTCVHLSYTLLYMSNVTAERFCIYVVLVANIVDFCYTTDKLDMCNRGPNHEKNLMILSCTPNGDKTCTVSTNTIQIQNHVLSPRVSNSKYLSKALNFTFLRKRLHDERNWLVTNLMGLCL